MIEWNLAAILAAGAALALTPAQTLAQEPAKPISMGLRLAPHPEGGEIAVVLPDRTGAALGFKVGDILVEAGGDKVSPQVLEAYMDGKNAGDQLSFKVKRGGAIVELTGKALAAPEAAPASTAQPEE